MRDGPAAGRSEIEGLLAKGELDNYPLAHSAKAELCRRAGQMDEDEAKASFEKALALTSQEQQAPVPACRNKMKFCGRLLSILRVFRDYLDGKAEANPNAESGGNHEIYMLWVSK